MRIVQTFWTAGKDPLHESFGWLHSEYNLMSWALSCLSLRAHYDEVALYTDSVGKHLLIDTLKLPYTEVNVVFDNFKCLPQHWALSKIKTYSLQTEPFLHVDGDVYISKPLPEDVIHSPLVAQNREIGTSYYKHMMNWIQSRPEIKLPEYVVKGLNEESVASYNMGFFGGTDVDFIQRYCDEVFHFMDSNKMNDSTSIGANLDCNVFFEQVIFAVYADREKRKVASVLGKDMHDKGYTRSEFCNLMAFNKHHIHHLLGGHKRNPYVLRMLVHATKRRHSKVFLRIMEICPDLKGKIFASPLIKTNHQTGYLPYLAHIEKKRNEWGRLNLEELIEHEEVAPTEEEIKATVEENRKDTMIYLSPYLDIFTLESPLGKEMEEYMRSRLSCGPHFPLKDIALTPTFSGYGYIETPLLPIDLFIIKVLSLSRDNYQGLREKILQNYFKGPINDFRQNYMNNSIGRLSVNRIINFKKEKL